MAQPLTRVRRVARAPHARLAETLDNHDDLDDQDDLEMFWVPPNPQTGPTVTLRRTGVPQYRGLDTRTTDMIRFFNGTLDTVTLSGVEVVPATTAEPRSTATNGPNGTTPPQGQDNMANGMMMDSESRNGGGMTTTAHHISGLRPRSVEDNNTWRSITAYDDLFVSYPDATGFDIAELLGIPENAPARYLDPPAPRLRTPPRLTVPTFGHRAWDNRLSDNRNRNATHLEGPTHCRACLEEVKDPIYLSCAHGYCRGCLNQLGIDMADIQTHLDQDVLTRYLDVVEEFSSRSPVYCANPICSKYIEQSRIRDSPDKFVQCGKCATVTCIECKQERLQHIGDDGMTCKEAEELMNAGDRKLAKNNRWKHCPGCKNLVEKIEGCNHMRCECGTDFCYRCGAKQEVHKACDCYGPHYRVPMTEDVLPAIRRAMLDYAEELERPTEGQDAATNNTHRRTLLQAAQAAVQLVRPSRILPTGTGRAGETAGQHERDDPTDARRRGATGLPSNTYEPVESPSGAPFAFDHGVDDNIADPSAVNEPSTIGSRLRGSAHPFHSANFPNSAPPLNPGYWPALVPGDGPEHYAALQPAVRGQKRELSMTDPVIMDARPALRMRFPADGEPRAAGGMLEPELGPVREAQARGKSQTKNRPRSSSPPTTAPQTSEIPPQQGRMETRRWRTRTDMLHGTQAGRRLSDLPIFRAVLGAHINYHGRVAEPAHTTMNGPTPRDAKSKKGKESA